MGVTSRLDKAHLQRHLLEVYDRLLAHYGPQGWWPGDGALEVMVGAILTQNTNWRNVEQALGNLKAAEVLTSAALRAITLSELERLVRPSGFFRAKASKLKALVDHLTHRWQGDLPRLFALPVESMRAELLSIKGIGPETADSIILYAAHKPVFVIDAYTCRIVDRVGLAPTEQSYAAYQGLFQEHLPRNVPLYNEYHALLVRHGKQTCRPAPRCSLCPLRSVCPWPEGGEPRSVA